MLRKACVLTGAVVLLLLAIPASAAETISISQVDYYQDGLLAAGDSEWGQVDVVYDQDQNLRWMNVVADAGTPDERWMVQNHPILPSGATGTYQYTSSSYFDLGVARGTNVSSMNISYSVDSTPWRTLSSLGTGTSYSVGTSQNIINSGVDMSYTTLNSPVSGLIDWDVLFEGLDWNFHRDMPNVTQELKWCGPGSAANSLHWLKKEGTIVLDQTLEDTQSELATDMGTDHSGTWDDELVRGKLKYIKDHSLGLEIHYTGGQYLPKVGDYLDPKGNGTARNDGAVSCEWIMREMKKGQDIEIMTRTHWVVIEGIICWDGICLLEYRDDPYQHGPGTTPGEREKLDKRHVWTYFLGGKTNIGNGNEVLSAAVAESVPEPSALLVLGSGFASIVAFVRRRPKRA